MSETYIAVNVIGIGDVVKFEDRWYTASGLPEPDFATGEYRIPVEEDSAGIRPKFGAVLELRDGDPA